MDKLSQQVFNQKHPTKPIKFWNAIAKYGENIIIDSNNSIAILRSKYKDSVYYKSVR